MAALLWSVTRPDTEAFSVCAIVRCETSPTKKIPRTTSRSKYPLKPGRHSFPTAFLLFAKYSCCVHNLSQSIKSISEKNRFLSQECDRKKRISIATWERTGLGVVRLPAQVGIHQARTLWMQRIAIRTAEGNEDGINLA